MVSRGGYDMSGPVGFRRQGDGRLTTSGNRETRSTHRAILAYMAALDHDACYRAILIRDPRFDGRFFTAVRTTHIYCRPICPARTPRSENIIFYPTAASAQAAGFRPCLRCRPEAAPGVGAWRGSSNTVNRALELIDAGALDELDVESLAARVGVGERQLRRLFRQHLGASPVDVAQTRRLLMAKQLITETRLSMTEIAAAAGFGSLRRFNEAIQALYKRPPTALRRERLAAADHDASGEIVLHLSYRPPLDWKALLDELAREAIPGVEHVTENDYRRVIFVEGEIGTVTVQATKGSALRASISHPKVAALPRIIACIRRVFDLDADPLAISMQLRRDPRLAQAVDRRPGLRVPGYWDTVELVARLLVGSAAALGELAKQHGAKLHRPCDGLTCAVPALQTLDSAEFARAGVPEIKVISVAAALRAIARDQAP